MKKSFVMLVAVLLLAGCATDRQVDTEESMDKDVLAPDSGVNSAMDVDPTPENAP
jgi:uncharacterized lipoprotein YajG